MRVSDGAGRAAVGAPSLCWCCMSDADLEVAVAVEQEVAGLEVAVDDVGGVDVLEAFEDLVDAVKYWMCSSVSSFLL